MELARIRHWDQAIMAALSRFLCDTPDAIHPEDIQALEACGVTRAYAYALLLAAHCGLDADGGDEEREVFRRWFLPMVKPLSAEEYGRDPYLRGVRFPEKKIGSFTAEHKHYKPYEAFVCDDMQKLLDGRILPQIGFFSEPFPYPAILENGRLWMSVTPNEIQTMRPAIQKATGHVLTYGLGLGYFVYRILQKPEVTAVTVVERSADAIALFREALLPQFPRRELVTIVQADAFDFAHEQMPKGDYSFVFTDLWHDVSDGLPLYERMKALEKGCPQAEFMYWIEPTMRCYL